MGLVDPVDGDAGLLADPARTAHSNPLRDCGPGICTAVKHAAIALLDEGARLCRFLSVGAAATLLHLSVAVALLTLDQVDPVAANGVAFMCGLVLSFWGHSRWTFGDKDATGSLRRIARFRRFFLVAVVAFATSNGLLLGLLRLRLLADELAVIASVGVIPIVTYSANRLWVFR